MDHRRATPSRRAVLRGAGILAGAAAVSGVAGGPAPAAATEVFDPALGSIGGPGGAVPSAGGEILPQVLTPGLSYRTYSQHAFKPNTAAAGYVPSAQGCYSDLFNAYMVLPLDLPSGVVIREVTACGLSVGASSAFQVSRYAIGIDAADEYLVGVPLVASSSLQTVTTSGQSHAVDPGYAYYVLRYTTTNGNHRVHSVRIGFSGGFGFTPVDPQVRKLDTRDPGPLSGWLAAGASKTLALTPQVPAGAASALVNLTITDTQGSGYLSLFPAGIAWPGTSSVNWFGDGQTLATSVTVALSGAGAIKLQAGGSGGAHVIVDLLGFYR